MLFECNLTPVEARLNPLEDNLGLPSTGREWLIPSDNEEEEEEEWREVNGVWVSNMGRVRSNRSGMEFVPSQHPSGYRTYHIGRKPVLVHRLVARAFIGDPPFPNASVDHVNRDRGDNRLVNLRYASSKEQIANRNRVDPCKESYFSDPSTSPKIDGELWKDVDGVHVSNMGRVHNKYGVAYTPAPSPSNGYCHKVRHGKNHQVHVLVARAFHGERPFPGATVDHINQVKHDNRAANLRWASRSQQGHNQTVTKSTVSAHLTRKVRGVHKASGRTETFSSIANASRETGAPRCRINDVLRGRKGYKSSKGWVWVYV